MTSPLQAVTTEEGRYYPRNGMKYMSVTTALSALPKDALMYWAAREVATMAVDCMSDGPVGPVAPGIGRGHEGAYILDRNAAIKYLKSEPLRQRDNAGSVGDEVHAAAEAILKGEPYPEPSKLAKPRIDQFLKWRDAFKPEPLFVEATVFNDTFGYAGSCDLMAVVPGYGPMVIDLKTSKGIYGSVALQAAAYKFAEYIVLDDGTEVSMPVLDRGAVLHVKARSCTFREVDVSQNTLLHFLSILNTKRYWIDRDEKTALMGDLSPGGPKFIGGAIG